MPLRLFVFDFVCVNNSPVMSLEVAVCCVLVPAGSVVVKDVEAVCSVRYGTSASSVSSGIMKKMLHAKVKNVPIPIQIRGEIMATMGLTIARSA